MEIRRKLAFQFTALVAFILVMAEVSVFIFSSILWHDDFYNRLQNKASAVAKLLIDVEGVNAQFLRLIEKGNLSLLPYEEIVIYNYKGDTIFVSQDTLHLSISHDLLNRIKVEKKVEFKQGRYTVLGFLYSGRYDRIVVVAGAIDIHGDRKLSTLRNILVIVFIMAMIIVYFTGKVYANRALNPILGVISEVKAIDEKHLNIRVNEGNGTDEIARLAQTFNLMLGRLEAAFKAQKHFIANASHELRTPLTYIMGRLEVSLMSDRTPEQYIQTIQSVIEDLKFLNSSANKLLLLAQASSDSHDIPFRTVRIDEVVWDARAELLKIVPGVKVTVGFPDSNPDPDRMQVRGNDVLLKTAFLNLMDNACKYSGDHTAEVTIQREGEWVSVVFADHGHGIPAEELELIFEPFFRSKLSHGKDGHGLGLALVHQIVRLHGGTVVVSSVLDEGSRFRVDLPVDVSG